jgi:hypothetical protein
MSIARGAEKQATNGDELVSGSHPKLVKRWSVVLAMLGLVVASCGESERRDDDTCDTCAAGHDASVGGSNGADGGKPAAIGGVGRAGSSAGDAPMSGAEAGVHSGNAGTGGGGNATGSTAPQRIAEVPYVSDLAVKGGYAYFGDIEADANGDTYGHLVRIPIDGGAPTVLAHGTPTGVPGKIDTFHSL